MSAAASQPLTGVWSGDRVTLTLTPTGGQLDEDCATSTISRPVRLNTAGMFAATGSHEAQGPGPTRLDASERPAFKPVHFSGRFTGAELNLDVQIAGAAVTHYRLRPGRNFKRIRCL